MEEKERYKVSVGSDYITIYDYEENRIKALDNCGIQSLLNLQDNQIKAKEKEANTYAKEITFLDNKIKQLKEKLNNFETCMEKYNVEDIEHLDLMLFVLSGETKYHLKEIKDKHKKELEQSQKQLAISKLEKVKKWCEEHKYSDDFDYVITYEYDEEDGSGNTDYLKDYIDNQIKQLKKEMK